MITIIPSDCLAKPDTMPKDPCKYLKLVTNEDLTDDYVSHSQSTDLTLRQFSIQCRDRKSPCVFLIIIIFY